MTLICLVADVFLALAVYNDAKAKANNEPILWAILVGIFGLIPGIIYLCIRNSEFNKRIFCPHCGFAHPISLKNCPQCGIYNNYSEPFDNYLTAEYKKKAKVFLIISLILIGVCFIFAIIMVCLFFLTVASYSDISYYSYYPHY